MMNCFHWPFYLEQLFALTFCTGTHHVSSLVILKINFCHPQQKKRKKLDCYYCKGIITHTHARPNAHTHKTHQLMQRCKYHLLNCNVSQFFISCVIFCSEPCLQFPLTFVCLCLTTIFFSSLFSSGHPLLLFLSFYHFSPLVTLSFLTTPSFLYSQCNVQPTKCVLTQRGSS